MTYKITESDASTGITIERDATPEEIADYKAREQKIANWEIEAQTKAQAKAELLERLGITEDEARLLLG